MKRCPECRRDYYDETLFFCLDDGNALLEGPSTADDRVTALMHRSEDGTHFNEDPAAVRPTHPPLTSVAVLPFVHLSSDPDDEFFCDGMSEELTNALARMEDLKVVARTSSFVFKGKSVPVNEIGSSLKVNHVVEGSVQKFGERMRITVQLVNTSDGYHLWSEKFDTEMRDLFDVQDEITKSVVGTLRSKLLGDRKQIGSPVDVTTPDLKERDVDAYQHYLRGRYFLNRFTPDDFQKAIECFNAALEIDRNFAPAYAAISEAHVSLTEFGPIPPLEGLPRAKEAALKAIALDPELSEAHGSLALVLQEYDFNFADAEKHYRIAIRLNPNNAIAHEYYGSLLAQLGRPREAEEQCLKAIELDPLSPIGGWFYPMALYLELRFDEAIREADRLLGLDPNFSPEHLILSFIYEALGERDKSANSFLRFLELCGMQEFADESREAYKTGGWDGYLRAMTSVEARSHLPAYFVAANYVNLGDHDAALWALEDSYARREGMVVLVNTDPRLDPLRNEIRFRDLIRKIGFPKPDIQ